MDKDRNYIDFKQMNENLIQRRKKNENYNNSLETKIFQGPKALQPLIDECFVFEDNKYFYRICMFSNITQHEKSAHFYSSFHAILGIWKEWYVNEEQFQFQLFIDGDECSPNLRRMVAVHLECQPNNQIIGDLLRIKNMAEVQKCIYLMTVQSPLFCGKDLKIIQFLFIYFNQELGTVYSHLDTMGQMEWDLIKSLNTENRLSNEQYEQYLKTLLNNYGLTLIGKNETFEDIFLRDNKESMELALKNCQQELIELRKKIKQLIN